MKKKLIKMKLKGKFLNYTPKYLTDSVIDAIL